MLCATDPLGSLGPMHLIFLPGASGAAAFWHPLGALLPATWSKSYLAWPGLGSEPHDPQINGFDDLVALTEKEIRGPTVLVAQSMGGIVAVRLALRHPELITHLILVATSGGVDVSALGGIDWRTGYLENFPDSQTWIVTDKPDHCADIARIACPVLLIWGDDDPISPPAVGARLAGLLLNSTLRIIPGGTHDLARDRAADVAAYVIAHLEG